MGILFECMKIPVEVQPKSEFVGGSRGGQGCLGWQPKKGLERGVERGGSREQRE